MLLQNVKKNINNLGIYNGWKFFYQKTNIHGNFFFYFRLYWCVYCYFRFFCFFIGSINFNSKKSFKNVISIGFIKNQYMFIPFRRKRKKIQKATKKRLHSFNFIKMPFMRFYLFKSLFYRSNFKQSKILKRYSKYINFLFYIQNKFFFMLPKTKIKPLKLKSVLIKFLIFRHKYRKLFSKAYYNWFSTKYPIQQDKTLNESQRKFILYKNDGWIEKLFNELITALQRLVTQKQLNWCLIRPFLKTQKNHFKKYFTKKTSFDRPEETIKNNLLKWLLKFFKNLQLSENLYIKDKQKIISTLISHVWSNFYKIMQEKTKSCVKEEAKKHAKALQLYITQNNINKQIVTALNRLEQKQQGNVNIKKIIKKKTYKLVSKHNNNRYITKIIQPKNKLLISSTPVNKRNHKLKLKNFIFKSRNLLKKYIIASTSPKINVYHYKITFSIPVFFLFIIVLYFCFLYRKNFKIPKRTFNLFFFQNIFKSSYLANPTGGAGLKFFIKKFSKNNCFQFFFKSFLHKFSYQKNIFYLLLFGLKQFSFCLQVNLQNAVYLLSRYKKKWQCFAIKKIILRKKQLKNYITVLKKRKKFFVLKKKILISEKTANRRLNLNFEPDFWENIKRNKKLRQREKLLIGNNQPFSTKYEFAKRVVFVRKKKFKLKWLFWNKNKEEKTKNRKKKKPLQFLFLIFVRKLLKLQIKTPFHPYKQKRVFKKSFSKPPFSLNTNLFLSTFQKFYRIKYWIKKSLTRKYRTNKVKVVYLRPIKKKYFFFKANHRQPQKKIYKTKVVLSLAKTIKLNFFKARYFFTRDQHLWQKKKLFCTTSKIVNKKRLFKKMLKRIKKKLFYKKKKKTSLRRYRFLRRYLKKKFKKRKILFKEYSSSLKYLKKNFIKRKMFKKASTWSKYFKKVSRKKKFLMYKGLLKNPKKKYAFKLLENSRKLFHKIYRCNNEYLWKKKKLLLKNKLLLKKSVRLSLKNKIKRWLKLKSLKQLPKKKKFGRNFKKKLLLKVLRKLIFKPSLIENKRSKYLKNLLANKYCLEFKFKKAKSGLTPKSVCFFPWRFRKLVKLVLSRLSKKIAQKTFKQKSYIPSTTGKNFKNKQNKWWLWAAGKPSKVKKTVKKQVKYTKKDLKPINQKLFNQKPFSHKNSDLNSLNQKIVKRKKKDLKKKAKQKYIAALLLGKKIRKKQANRQLWTGRLLTKFFFRKRTNKQKYFFKKMFAVWKFKFWFAFWLENWFASKYSFVVQTQLVDLNQFFNRFALRKNRFILNLLFQYQERSSPFFILFMASRFYKNITLLVWYIEKQIKKTTKPPIVLSNMQLLLQMFPFTNLYNFKLVIRGKLLREKRMRSKKIIYNLLAQRYRHKNLDGNYNFFVAESKARIGVFSTQILFVYWNTLINE